MVPKLCPMLRGVYEFVGLALGLLGLWLHGEPRGMEKIQSEK